MEKQMKSNLNSVANSSLNSASWNQKASTILNNKEEPTQDSTEDTSAETETSTEENPEAERASYHTCSGFHIFF